VCFFDPNNALFFFSLLALLFTLMVEAVRSTFAGRVANPEEFAVGELWFEECESCECEESNESARRLNDVAVIVFIIPLRIIGVSY
jgi:hypothetical protein